MFPRIVLGQFVRVLTVLCGLLFLSVAHAASDPRFALDRVVSGLDVPWGMAFLDPNRLLITERKGRAKILLLDTGVLAEISGLPPVDARGQGGLLDVALVPDASARDWIYFTYSKPFGQSAVTTLARARLAGLELVDWQDLLITQSASDTTRHFGSRIAFDGNGHVFFTVGDRGVRENAQDRENHAGGVLRVRLDGRVPADNPWVNTPQVRPEIWSYGHRNPQGIAFDARGQLWVIEHGPRGGDEINKIEPGKNYGWPVISYGKEYLSPRAVGEGTHKEGMMQPVKEFTPSIAPGSLLIYSGKAFPAWRGHFFSGALKLRHLNRVEMDADDRVLEEERMLTELETRIRAVIEDPMGWIYFSTDSGEIYRIRPEDS